MNVFDLFEAPFALLFAMIGICLSLACGAFMLWVLLDCVGNEPATGNDKVVWLLMIVLVPWPIGALIYYFFRRPDRICAYGH
jgi:hypothetical protein